MEGIFLLCIVAGIILGGICIVGITREVIESPKREAMLNQVKAKQDTKLVCPHCQTTGHVTTKQTTVKRGISGGKATAAILTGGVSMLATGLSQCNTMTRATCSNCGSTWLF